MTIQKIKAAICRVWTRFNLSWAHASEMQKRIDDAREEQLKQHHYRRF